MFWRRLLYRHRVYYRIAYGDACRGRRVVLLCITITTESGWGGIASRAFGARVRAPPLLRVWSVRKEPLPTTSTRASGWYVEEGVNKKGHPCVVRCCVVHTYVRTPHQYVWLPIPTTLLPPPLTKGSEGGEGG